MPQTITRTFVGGAAKTGLAMGYRVLNPDRTVYAAFTIVDVVESTVPGTYSIDNGFAVPDAGGYIVWGTSGTDIFEGDIESSLPTVVQIQSGLATTSAVAAVQAAVTALNNLSAADAQTAAIAALTAYTAATQADVTGAVAGLSTFDSTTDPVTVGTNNDKTGYRLSAAGVDDILDEALSEPVAAPTWSTATLRKSLAWVFALAYHKIVQTSTLQTLRNEADAVDVATSVQSDDGSVYTRNRWL